MASRPADDQRPVLMMAQDEGRFGRICRPRACWAPPGVRPTAPCQLVREFVQVFAAVAPQTGELISLILPTANTAMMNLFLAHVSQALADYFLVMQVDQAGWHHSRNLQVPDNIRLIAQPAHSRSASIPSSICGRSCGKSIFTIESSLPSIRWRSSCVRVLMR